MERPQTTYGHTIRIKTGCGNLYVTCAEAESYKEIFCKLGKSGGCATAFLDGIGRLITHALNDEIVTEETIIRSFSEIRCPSPQWNGDVQVLSCVDAIAKILKSNKKEISNE